MECYNSRRAIVRAVVEMLSVPVLPVVCHLLLRMFLPQVAIPTWSLLALYALPLVVLATVARRLSSRGPQVVLNETGLEDRRKAIGIIEWSDIRKVSIREIHGTQFIGVDVADTEKYCSRSGWWHRAGSRSLQKRGHPPIAVSFAMLEPSLDEVWAYLKLHHGDLTGP